MAEIQGLRKSNYDRYNKSNSNVVESIPKPQLVQAKLEIANETVKRFAESKDYQSAQNKSVKP